MQSSPWSNLHDTVAIAIMTTGQQAFVLVSTTACRLLALRITMTFCGRFRVDSD